MYSTDVYKRKLIRRTVDSTVYYVEISWSGKAVLSQTGKNRLKLTPSDKQWNFNVGFYKHQPVAVSYTHLDVYKRQELQWLCICGLVGQENGFAQS